MPEKYLKPLTSKVKHHEFAVFDLETTVDLEKAYLLGFYDGTDYKVFNVPQETRNGLISAPHYPEDSMGVVSQFLTWIFSNNRYCKTRIYAHNGGSFDFLYLIRWLLDHGDEYGFTVIPIQSSILMLEVRSRAKQTRKWTFLDSYRLMNAPLEKLGQTFKGVGKVKDVKYETLHRDPRRFEYLRQDCVLLYDCLSEFYSMVLDAGGEIGITAASSAMASYRRMHLSRWIPINAHFEGCKCEGKGPRE